jgi:glyoxylase-like metal-dependent hydrolase (beta-lactamase superfamily II)
MQKLTENVYAEVGFRGCNPGFVVTADGVVMIDTPQRPSDALKWKEIISKFGPVRYVINTEPHRDHFATNMYFDGVVVAHEGTREAILSMPVQQLVDYIGMIDPDSKESLAGYSLRAPTVTLTQQLNLYVGKHSFQIIHMPGHTPYQVAVYIPQEKVVFTSDNVFGKVQAWLPQAMPYDWLESLGRLKQLDVDILVPGHGEICNRQYLDEMSGYIKEWIDAVDAAIKKGLSLEEAQNTITIGDRYPMEAGTESMAQVVPRANVARLYQVLKP